MLLTEHRINLTAAEVRDWQAGGRELRRRVKPQPDEEIDGYPYWYIGGFRADAFRRHPKMETHFNPSNPITSPFGSPGDVLVLREAIELRYLDGNTFPSPVYKADREHVIDGRGKASNHEFMKRRVHPSNCMPRWAVRYTARVLSVSVEQVDGVWWWVARVEEMGGENNEAA